ncbi:hypothetical protein TNCV_666881 [Trichonephila clavipes]|nr:hypothetical protein TNCV_666881 [Trichonephila clavipes]
MLRRILRALAVETRKREIVLNRRPGTLERKISIPCPFQGLSVYVSVIPPVRCKSKAEVPTAADSGQPGRVDVASARSSRKQCSLRAQAVK